MADCIHHLDLCPDCASLRVTQMDRLEGVTGISLDGAPLGEVTAVYIGPVPGPCPNPPEEQQPDA
ncbi:hypothetical protein [Streptomyces bobili]|uniref:hypothetical protein n=1 Tax=Streptomyces bobili TaxID=67280 RepID=UPI0037B99D8A